MSEKKKDDLELIQEVFEMLQGRFPEGYRISRGHVPKLTADQAWTAIWFIQGQYQALSERIERCCVCGSLYDSWREGDCLDYGRAPYNFCDGCMRSEPYVKKMRRNPDKEEMKAFFEH